MKGFSILVVEDSSGSRILFRTLLEGAGFHVKCAKDARDALQILTHFQPDLILMDLLLPDISGLELTRQLKANPATRETMIVAITACSLASDAEEALAGGCAGFIVKPSNPREFVARVRSYLGVGKPVRDR